MFGNQSGSGDDDKPKKYKNKVFVPASLAMVDAAQPGPNDECEFDGEGVSELVLLGRVMSIAE